MKIRYYGSFLEAKACQHFLQWQLFREINEPIEDGLLLRMSGGHPVVVIEKDDKVIAVGFKDLIKYWNEQGLWLI